MELWASAHDFTVCFTVTQRVSTRQEFKLPSTNGY